MSKKVVLTQEQADEIELQKKDFSKFDDIVTRRILTSDINGYYNKTFHSISVDDLIKALYIGYEVEPEFNVGDWVHVSWSNNNPSVHKVIKTGVRSTCGNKNGIEIDWGGSPTPPLDIIRHATPEEIEQEKERRWWKSHNRDVWELREGDILSMDGYENVTMAVKEVIHENITLLNGEDEEYMFLYDIKNLLSVVCFAEDRKDV